jgi:hypothetical protein
MKTKSYCPGCAALLLIMLLTAPVTVSAYHFEIVSISGKVETVPNFYYTGVTEDFVYGPVTAYQADQFGDRTATSNLLFSGNTCVFEGSGIVNMNTTTDVVQSLATTRPLLFLRVVSDPGDPATASLAADWNSSSYSESHDQSADLLCYGFGYVESIIRIDGIPVLDMGKDRETGSTGGTTDLGIVPDGAIISLGRYDSEGIFVRAIIQAVAFSVNMDCIATGSAANSFTLTLDGVPDDPGNDIDISCEITGISEPTKTYTYVLKNTTSSTVTLNQFYLGTMDVVPTNYTNWVAPAGFTPVVADWATLQATYGASMMATSGYWAAYGTVLTGPAQGTAAGILWYGSISLEAGETATFGFDNQHLPFNMEWFAEHPDAANSSQGYLGYPVAGPLGTYSDGYVLGPGLIEVSTESSTWGKIKKMFE